MMIVVTVCALLYVLGGVLAFELYEETDAPPSIDTIAKRIVTVVFWPSVAVYLLFGRSEAP